MPHIRRPAAKLSPTVSCFEDTLALESRDQAAHVPTPLQNASDNCLRNASDASLASVDSETTGERRVDACTSTATAGSLDF